MKHLQRMGFTIVELLIVIVVIGILAAITIVAYNGVQARANQAKIRSDLEQLNRAVQIARNETGKTMIELTGSDATANNCVSRPTGTDLSSRSGVPSCWASYDTALLAISNASGVNVKNLTDPWKRPYFIDENEGASSSCTKDSLGVYPQPFVTGWSSVARVVDVPNSIATCL